MTPRKNDRNVDTNFDSLKKNSLSRNNSNYDTVPNFSPNFPTKVERKLFSFCNTKENFIDDIFDMHNTSDIVKPIGCCDIQDDGYIREITNYPYKV